MLTSAQSVLYDIACSLRIYLLHPRLVLLLFLYFMQDYLTPFLTDHGIVKSGTHHHFYPQTRTLKWFSRF